jgi:twitching motility protein PilI
MANRQALRELQIRLASRLQTARAEGMSVAWLALRSGGHNYLFPLSQSGEIVPLVNLQPVPYALPWFRGVINIRGNLFGVVDFARFVASHGGSEPTEPPVTEPSVVSLNTALEVNCTLQVDVLSGLRGVDAFTSTVPVPDGAPAFFGNRFVDSAGAQWQEINLRTLSQTAQFLSISV